jgi:GNAT superfamily N-acetyltransferase
MTGLAVTVRPAASADIRPLATVMARAFFDDPPFVWMLPEAGTRQARTKGLFATTLRTEALRYRAVEVACADGAIVGGAIWFPPGHWQPTVLDQLRALPGYARALGRRIGPASVLLTSLARAHPRDPHWYLYAIGVDPGSQGRGVAGSLLRSRLQRCDQAGEPAYLESSKTTNVPLYQHFGFQPTGTPPLPDGAPVITAMWRPPAA